MIPKGVILHCSDSDIKSHDDISVIDDWHRERGFKMVGYMWFVTSLGEPQRGRFDSVMGAHCKGHNDYIGICLHGRNEFSDEQFETATALVKFYMKKYGFTKKDIYPHNYFSDKTCPNFNIEDKILNKI